MPLIIPIFIMNRGCPNHCVFCNEAITAGEQASPFAEDTIGRTVRTYLDSGGVKQRRGAMSREMSPQSVQIAFYGGNFTGLSRDEQTELLRRAKPFIDQGLVGSVRISTRPDAIDAEWMAILKAFHVRTVEIGAQSMADAVLAASRRGHSAADVRSAVEILKTGGFEVGLHLMVGLPGDSRESFSATVEAAVAMKPDMVRIHPTLVFRDTPLAEAYILGDYQPLTMAEALASCKYAVNRFAEARIPVIRLGLQTTREMEAPGAVMAGPFHPAFGSLVESAVFLDRASHLLEERDMRDQWVTFHVPSRKESAFRGERNENLRILAERFRLAGIRVQQDDFFHVSV